MSIRVTENVERGGIVGCEFGGLFVMRDGLRDILLTEVITTESEVSPLIIRISSDKLVENLFLLCRIRIGACFGSLDQHAFTIRSFVCQGHCLFQVFEKLFGSR